MSAAFLPVCTEGCLIYTHMLKTPDVQSAISVPAQDDTGHLREVGLQDRKEELYMVRVEVQGFEGLVVEGMQQLLRRKQVGQCPLSFSSRLQDGRIAR